MFANMDYPVDDPALPARASRREAAQLLDRAAPPSRRSPCCAAAARWRSRRRCSGLPPSAVDAARSTTSRCPRLSPRCAPDVPYVPIRPSGGDAAVPTRRGVAHYYGVGAYLRPLEDARRADVRFASECLAFANVPERRNDSMPSAAIRSPPAWKARVPRDRGAGWDFEDVRDHYLRAALWRRSGTPARRGSRPLSAPVARRQRRGHGGRRSPNGGAAASSCAGALVWLLKDFGPGAGWGVIDLHGRAQARLARAASRLPAGSGGAHRRGPERARPASDQRDRRARCGRAFAQMPARRRQRSCMRRERELGAAAPKPSHDLTSADLIGSFFDITYAYGLGRRRFMPRSWRLTIWRAARGLPTPCTFRSAIRCSRSTQACRWSCCRGKTAGRSRFARRDLRNPFRSRTRISVRRTKDFILLPEGNGWCACWRPRSPTRRRQARFSP